LLILYPSRPHSTLKEFHALDLQGNGFQLPVHERDGPTASLLRPDHKAEAARVLTNHQLDPTPHGFYAVNRALPLRPPPRLPFDKVGGITIQLGRHQPPLVKPFAYSAQQISIRHRRVRIDRIFLRPRDDADNARCFGHSLREDRSAQTFGPPDISARRRQRQFLKVAAGNARS